MKKDSKLPPVNSMLLSEALRMAKERGWPPTPLREAVVAGAIPSWRSSNRLKARYYVQWADIEKHMRGLPAVA